MGDFIIIGFISKEKFQKKQDDLHKEKICLIEDIFKIEKLLYGFQTPGHDKWLTNPGELFNTLYDLSIDDLQLHYSVLSAEMSQYARKLAGL